MLHTRRFRESSKIVTLYTRDYGRVSLVARGVMQPKNRYGSVLQPMAHISVHFYRKEGRELHNMSGAEGLGRRGALGGSLERMSAGLAIVEIVNAAVHDEDRNDELFDVLTLALDELNNASSDPATVQLWFLLRLASVLGYAVTAHECGVCGEEIAVRDPMHFSLASGAPLCGEHADTVAGRPVSQGTFGLLSALLQLDIASARSAVPAREAMELLDLLTAFIRFHVDGMRRLKVRGVSAKLGDAGTAA